MRSLYKNNNQLESFSNHPYHCCHPGTTALTITVIERLYLKLSQFSRINEFSQILVCPCLLSLSSLINLKLSRAYLLQFILYIASIHPKCVVYSSYSIYWYTTMVATLLPYCIHILVCISPLYIHFLLSQALFTDHRLLFHQNNR